MIKNVLPSLRQRAGPQRICSRQKSIRSGTARDSFSQTPHMRGKAKGDEFGLGQTRITPACAGKRQFCPPAGRADKDHPRVCGEKASLNARIAVPSGSPPRMRGKVFISARTQNSQGITPAYAGKSLITAGSHSLEGDHPRVCGEKVLPISLATLVRGSPPRMRGKVCLLGSKTGLTGITPACAGKRKPRIIVIRQFQDHPRTCGEKGLSTFWSRNHSGSPPHMRGKDYRSNVRSIAPRITPAHAGKRPRSPVRASLARDHPRTCGEKDHRPIRPLRTAGSPPHMRGKVRVRLRSSLLFGITPAHAGKRVMVCYVCAVIEDHPRTCGEKRKTEVHSAQSKGSPPHMRGKVRTGRSNRANKRITPAHAGKRFWFCCELSDDGDHPRTCGEKLMFCQKSTPS